MKSKLYTFSIIALTAAVIAACSSSENKPSLNDKIVFENKSVNPALAFAMPGFETKLQINTLISSDDQLVQSPSFVFGAANDILLFYW